MAADGAVRVLEGSQSVVARERGVRVRVAQRGGGGGVPYAGPYEVEPSEEEQVLPTAGMVMRSDLVVAPVPSGYGRVERRGSALIVY